MRPICSKSTQEASPSRKTVAEHGVVKYLLRLLRKIGFSVVHNRSRVKPFPSFSVACQIPVFYDSLALLLRKFPQRIKEKENKTNYFPAMPSNDVFTRKSACVRDHVSSSSTLFQGRSWKSWKRLVESSSFGRE